MKKTIVYNKTSLLSHLQKNKDDVESWLVLGDLLQEEGDLKGQIINFEYRLQQEKDEIIKEKLWNEIALYYISNKFSLSSAFAKDSINRIYPIEYKWGYLRHVDIDVNDLESLRSLINNSDHLFLDRVHLCGKVVYCNLQECFEILKKINISYLDLSGNIINDKGIEIISKSDFIRSLSKLNLFCCMINTTGRQILLQSIGDEVEINFD